MSRSCDYCPAKGIVRDFRSRLPESGTNIGDMDLPDLIDSRNTRALSLLYVLDHMGLDPNKSIGEELLRETDRLLSTDGDPETEAGAELWDSVTYKKLGSMTLRELSGAISLEVEFGEAMAELVRRECRSGPIIIPIPKEYGGGVPDIDVICGADLSGGATFTVSNVDL
jgi:hypothetical protein